VDKVTVRFGPLCRGAWLTVAEALEELETVHHRHVDIQQDEVRISVLADPLQPGGAVGQIGGLALGVISQNLPSRARGARPQLALQSLRLRRFDDVSL
jgi:hypothetical protein